MAPQETAEVARPTSEADVARVLADAQRRGLKVSPRGGGTKTEWGQSPVSVDLVLSTLGLSRVLEHAAGDMTATVEAGCTISALRQALATHNQRLALDPLWPDHATVGGVIATNDSGSLRAGFGSLRDLILGVTVALPDGTLAASGGKVVKNVAGYDLPKLMVGAYGTLGVVTRATFRLHPLPAATRTLQFAALSPEDAEGFVLAMHDSGPPVTGLQVTGGSGQPWRVAARLEGSAAGVEATSAQVGELAARCRLEDSVEPDDPWVRREHLWRGLAAVAKVTLLPSELAALCRAIEGPVWSLVAQGNGAALVAMPDEDVLRLAEHMRESGNYVVVLSGSDELKRQMNPLQDMDALPLMRRIKQQFDPSGTLNRGRLGGGI